MLWGRLNAYVCVHVLLLLVKVAVVYDKITHVKKFLQLVYFYPRGVMIKEVWEGCETPSSGQKDR